MAYLRYAVCGCCLCIKNANCYILGEDVKWCGGCARRRGGCFLFRSNGFALRAGQSAGLVFSLSRFARWWRGVSFILWSNGFALRAGQRQGGVFRIPPPYLWTPLSPQRVKGCSPLTIPKMRSKPKNASRFAKRIFLCFSHLRLRRRFHLPAGRYRQQRRNTRCGSSKSEKREKSV